MLAREQMFRDSDCAGAEPSAYPEWEKSPICSLIIYLCRESFMPRSQSVNVPPLQHVA